MTNLLKELELEELSLVDRPANPQAMVALFKRDMKEEDSDMEEKIKAYMEDKGCDRKAAEEALMKSFEEAETLKADVEGLRKENERLRKGLIEEGYVIKADVIEKKAPEEFIEYEGEKINKADVPAPILKALEAAEIEKADRELTKRAEEKLPHFNVDVAKKLIESVEKMDEVEMLMEALEAADKAFSDKMEELGKSEIDGNFESANDKMDAMVKTYMKEHELKKSQYALAYAEVAKTDEGREVLKAIRKGD